LDVEGDFNSFRIGQSLQYQRTYLFPPKPTIIGLAGAALGLADNELERLYTDILVGTILNQYQGLARDLWGITKFKTVGTEHAVVVREMLHRPYYSIYFAPSKTALSLKELQAAFADPVYPLSLGRSDELVVVKSLRITDLATAKPGACYRNTVLPFDYRKRGYILKKVTEMKHGVLELPQVITIPEVYSYDKTRKRSVTQYRVVTHVFSTGAISKESDGGLRDGERNLFLY
jgi:CRISPR-associated protein Cas5t